MIKWKQSNITTYKFTHKNPVIYDQLYHNENIIHHQKIKLDLHNLIIYKSKFPSAIWIP